MADAKSGSKKEMEAVYQSGWGGREQLSVRTVPRSATKPGWVMVRVAAVSMHAGDHHMLTGRPYIIRAAVGRREIPGMDFAGFVVEDCSTDGKTLSAGDRVLGTSDVFCGAFAEFVCVPRASVALIPDSVDFETAAAVPTSAMTALQALRVGRPTERGDRVLINGASGGVGTFAVQLAKAAGAHVTGVCSSRNVDLVRKVGADDVIDYTKDGSYGLDRADKFDRIVDLVGNRTTSRWSRLMKPEGHMIAVSLGESELIVPFGLLRVALSNSYFSKKSFHLFHQEVSDADLDALATMLGEGTLKPAIGRRSIGLPAIPDALSNFGHSSGKTVVRILDDAPSSSS